MALTVTNGLNTQPVAHLAPSQLSPELDALIQKSAQVAEASKSLPIFIQGIQKKVVNAGESLPIKLATLVYAAMADKATDYTPAIQSLMGEIPDKNTFDKCAKLMLCYVQTAGNKKKFGENEALVQFFQETQYQEPIPEALKEEPVQAAEESPTVKLEPEQTEHEEFVEPSNSEIVALDDIPAPKASGSSKWLWAIPVMTAAATGIYFASKWYAEQSMCGYQNPFDFNHTAPSFNTSRTLDVPSPVETPVANNTSVESQALVVAKKTVEVIEGVFQVVYRRVTLSEKVKTLLVAGDLFCTEMGEICLPICDEAGKAYQAVMNHLGSYNLPERPWITCNPIKF